MTQRLYRGKRKDGDDWVQGYFFNSWEQTYILWGTTNGVPSMIEVDPNTVGQALGIQDRNGMQIFVGDICKDSLGWIYEVTWDVDNSRYIGRHSKPRGDTYICYVNRVDKHDRSAVEVIGNIYDSPELLTA